MFVIIFIFVALTFILLYRWIKIKERGEGAGGAGGANLDPGGGGMSADPGRGGGAEAAGGELGFVWRRRFYAITALALFLRIAFASAIEGFPSDIMCFKGWSQAAAENFFTLYDRGADWFIDYPPGYMYVLLVIGKIREIFQIPSESGLYTLLVKLPSILADVLSGMLLYALAGLGQNAAPREGGGLARRIGGHAVGGLTADGHTVVAGLSERTRLLITAFYYFNPVVFFISTIWGQVDSIMTLLILAAVLCLLRGRHCASGVFYALSVLLKPQGIIFLPVAFFLLLHGLITRGDWRAPLKTALGAIATAVVVTLPFELRHGADWVINLYSNTLSGYKLASMNAFNFFALIGGNWKDDSETLFLFSYATWGMLAIVFFTALTGLFVFRMRAQKTVPDCYTMLMGSALLLFSVVTFGHRMHERYFFPVILLQLAAGLFYESGGDSGESGRARRPGGFGGFGGLGGALLSHAWITLSGFLNVLFVFSAFYTNSSSAFYENAWIYVISALNVSAAVFLWIHAFRRMMRGGGLRDSLRERRGGAPRAAVP
ncbi:MAG: glycosyltransferase 87 family protein, partial [Clostridiales bacterium]|nr:glycosyltransferase 87 family protein [Clostridiales bacterium]